MFQTARTTAQWEAAEAAYREALALHPGLARAHVDLAGALFSAASPQRIGFASVSTPEAVRAAAAELETARGLGWDDLATRGDGGFYETLLALAEPGGDHAARAVELTAGALDLAPDLPVLHYNHAAALLAAGRIEEALAAYDEGIAVSTATGPDGTPVFTEASRWDVASGALTDLELIGAARREDPQIGSAIEQVRTLIVAGLGDPVTNTDPAAQPVVSDLTLNALPSQLWWEARIEGFDAQRDTVSVVWSYEDPALPGRHVLASHTGPLRLGQTTTAGGFYVDGEAPAYWASRSYLLGSIPHRCLPDGSYRVELFVDGRPAAEPVTRDLDEPELAAESRPDMGVLFCRPADWVAGDQEDGSRASFRSSDGSASMTAYRYPPTQGRRGRACPVGPGHGRADGGMARPTPAAHDRPHARLPHGTRRHLRPVVRRGGGPGEAHRWRRSDGHGLCGRAAGDDRMGGRAHRQRDPGLVHPAVRDGRRRAPGACLPAISAAHRYDRRMLTESAIYDALRARPGARAGPRHRDPRHGQGRDGRRPTVSRSPSS